MTLEELNQFQAIERLIEREKEELESMRESLGLHGANLSGMPRSQGARDKIGETMPGILDKERNLEDELFVLQSLRDKIVRWVNTLPNYRLSLIARLRFVDGKSWEEVADAMDDGKTADACKKALYRCLDAEQGKKEGRETRWKY